MLRVCSAPYRALAGGLCAAALVLAAPLHADEPERSDAARAAYDRGTQAYGRADYAVAAREFALADALAPHPVALKWALSAAVRADDPVLGMTLVARADRGPIDPPLASALGEARQRFERRVGAITVSCPTGLPCEARVDGAAASLGARIFVTPGAHLVEIAQPGGVERRWASVDGGGAVEIAGAAPGPPLASPTPAPEPGGTPALPLRRAPEADLGADGGGISPAWFWLGVGVTAALGGATIASGVDTLAKHDDYLQTLEPGGDRAGRSAQTRTNVLIGATVAAGVASALVGLLAVRWSSGPTTGARAR